MTPPRPGRGQPDRGGGDAGPLAGPVRPIGRRRCGRWSRPGRPGPGTAWSTRRPRPGRGIRSGAQPPISSLASVNGPSRTVKSLPSYWTLTASPSGPTPPVASSTPALVASSTNLPISAMSSGVGGAIGALGSPRVYPRNFMVHSLSGPAWLPLLTRASNAVRPDRHGPEVIFPWATFGPGNIAGTASVADRGGTDAACPRANGPRGRLCEQSADRRALVAAVVDVLHDAAPESAMEFTACLKTHGVGVRLPSVAATSPPGTTLPEVRPGTSPVTRPGTDPGPQRGRPGRPSPNRTPSSTRRCRRRRRGQSPKCRPSMNWVWPGG